MKKMQILRAHGNSKLKDRYGVAGSAPRVGFARGSVWWVGEACTGEGTQGHRARPGPFASLRRQLWSLAKAPA